MRVELGFTDFMMSLVLLGLTFVVVYGVRLGLYWVSGKVYGYLPDVLSEPVTPITMTDTDVRLRLLVTLLDPFLSWFSVIFTLLGFLFLQLIDPNVFYTTLVLYLCMLAGFIFPWRLFRRIFDWMTSRLHKKGIFIRPFLGVASLVSSILLFYTLFFLVLFSMGPFLLELYGMFDPGMKTLTRQLYIQHVQAYVPTLGVGLLYVVFDYIKQNYRRLS